MHDGTNKGCLCGTPKSKVIFSFLNNANFASAPPNKKCFTFYIFAFGRYVKIEEMFSGRFKVINKI